MVQNAATLATDRPDEIALRDSSNALTWSDVDDRANRIANGLHALLRGPQRRIAVFAENSAEVLLLHVAAINAGVSVVAMSYHLKEEETTYILRDSHCEAVFVGPSTAAVAAAAAKSAGTPHVIGWRGADPSLAASFEDWLASQSPAAPPVDVESLANVLYTSGTTGVPKRVETPPVLFHGGKIEAYVESLRQFRFFMHQGLHLVSGPMYHTGPQIAARLLAVGKPVVVLERFDPVRFLATVQKFGVETTLMVPTHFVKLLELPMEVRESYDVSSLQFVLHTGSACPADVKRAMIDWFGPVFVESYGGTEVGTVCRIDSHEWLERPGSVGRVQPPFARAVIVDDDGVELPAGADGRLYFEDPSGRGLVYGGDEEKTRAAHLREGVFTLGDIGHVDDEGYVFITDRFSDMIISGGVNIYPAEAEKILGEHPGIADVAVIGVPDSVMGESVVALVVPLDGARPVAAEDLMAYCRERLAGYKCPRAVEFVDDLGRNALGKLNKRELKRTYPALDRSIG